MSKRLLTVLGITFGLAAIVGNTIGAGILSAPGNIAVHLATPALYFAVWVAGALYALGGANAISELATMMPRSGGQYHFAREALGNYAGFLVGWNDWISSAGSVTAVALVLAESFVKLAPAFDGYGRTIAAAVIVLFTGVVWHRVQFAALVQNVTTLIKALAFLTLIGAGFLFAARHGVATPTPVVTPHGMALFAAFIVAMQSVIFAYDGWTGAIYFSEEIRDPGRAIPRATFGGLLAVVAFYLLLNAAFAIVLPLGKLAGDPLAASTVAHEIFGGRGDMVIRLIIVLALPSTVNALLQMASRVLFSMSRDNLAPKFAERVNAGGTPTMALLASCVVALLFLATGAVDAVIAVLSFLFVATYGLSFLSLFVLRVRQPERERPFRARGHPWTTGVMAVGSLAFLVGSVLSDPRNGLIAAGVVVVSYPAYRLLVR